MHISIESYGASAAGPRRALFEELTSVRTTLIFYETGPRLADSLADMAAVLPGRHDFVTEIQPAVFLADIGSVNAAIHGHRPSHVRPPPIGAARMASSAS